MMTDLAKRLFQLLTANPAQLAAVDRLLEGTLPEPKAEAIATRPRTRRGPPPLHPAAGTS